MKTTRVMELFDAKNIVGGEPAPLTKNLGYPEIIASKTDRMNTPDGSMTKREVMNMNRRPGYGFLMGGYRTRNRTRNRTRKYKKRTSRRK